MVVICDSSALIPLSLINQLHRLEEMFGGVLIPQGVYDEVVEKGEGRAGAEEVRNAPFIQTKELQNPQDAEPYIDPLSQPDAEVIALAKQEEADLIITRDRRLRRRARQEGLGAITLWNFLVEVKEAGIIPEVKPLLDELRNKGVLIREGVYQETLRQAGGL